MSEVANKVSLRSQLKRMKGRGIRHVVACVALQRSKEEIPNFFNDLLSHGCISGMIPELVYYNDTHRFYDYYYHEIEEIRERHEKEMDHPIVIQGDLKNFFAWFAFEWVAREVVAELNIEW